MGIFDRVFGKSKTPKIVQELLALKAKISDIPQAHQTKAFVFGAGAGKAREQIPIICRNIDEAVRALNTGLDPYNQPITKPQIANGLKCLVDATQRPAFVGLITAVLSSSGVAELKKCMNELERIANRIK